MPPNQPSDASDQHDAADDVTRTPRHAAGSTASAETSGSETADAEIAGSARKTTVSQPEFGPRRGYERSADEPFRDRVKDVLSLRTIALIVGVMVVQLAFIASYVGAFHSPDPHALTVTVVGTKGYQNYTANQLNKIEGRPVWAYASTDRAGAEQDLRDGRRQAVFVVNQSGKQDTLLVSSAQGASISQAMETIFQQVGASQHRSVTVRDIVPAQRGDGRGLTSFYLVVGWLVGGYLVATLLGMRGGMRPRNFRRVLWRLLGCVVYGVVSGLGGALIVDTAFDALTGHFWALAAVGTLVSLTASVFALGFEALLGTIGVGITIMLFVVLGNPSAGGAYGYQLLPTFWRVIGPWLPNGAGVDAIRSVVYLDSDRLGVHLGILGWWLALGLLTLLLVSNNTYWGFKQERNQPLTAEESERRRDPDGLTF